jgi:hypothetical protein
LTRALAIPNRAPPNLCDEAFLSVLALVAASAAAHKTFAAQSGGTRVAGCLPQSRLP